MKTNLISKAVVMMVVVMASVMNFSASASNPTQYVKNEEMTGELMTAKTIFKNEDVYKRQFLFWLNSCFTSGVQTREYIIVNIAPHDRTRKSHNPRSAA